jgi:hypothetical protein
MKDVDLIHEFLIDGKNDKTGLDILVSKISDRDLLLGFLMDMTINSEAYGLDKSMVMLVVAEVATKEELESKYLSNCVKYYSNLLHEKNEEELEKNTFFSLALGAILTSGINSNIVDKILSKAKLPWLKELKNTLLKEEVYELLSIIDKHIELKGV